MNKWFGAKSNLLLSSAKAGPAVSGLLSVPRVPLEVPAPDPPHVRLLRHTGLVRSLSRTCPGLLLLRTARRRWRHHIGGLLQWHPAPGEPVLQRLRLHPPGFPGDAVCGLSGGVLALLLQDGHASSRRIPGKTQMEQKSKQVLLFVEFPTIMWGKWLPNRLEMIWPRIAFWSSLLSIIPAAYCLSLKCLSASARKTGITTTHCAETALHTWLFANNNHLLCAFILIPDNFPLSMCIFN